MCIAILSQQDKVVPLSHLKESFRCNSDGAGFMYAENNELHIEKGFMDFDSFYQAYKPHEEKPIAIHFRITTHGDTNQDNTHPFQVGNNLGFIHNGVISKVDCSADKGRSDTFHFNEKILVPIYKRDSRFIFKEHFKELIKEYIGWSKLVFLNNKGHFTIINEDKGHWNEGIWYSNNSYKVVEVAPRITPVRTSGLIVGDKVSVFNRGTGVVKYFGGGNRIGVGLDAGGPTELFSIMMVNKLDTKKFEEGDWVVHVDNSDTVGEVTGYVGKLVMVKWLRNGGFDKVSNSVVEDKLEFWWSNAEAV